MCQSAGMAQTDSLVTSFQAAVMLGKSPRTIQRMADSGALPFVQKLPGPNGAYLFNRTQVEALAAETVA
jgi:excisionase family DNA binding protein